jgi:hypothetical protein
MGACLNGMVCIRSAREETHPCGVLEACVPREWAGFPHGLHFWLLYLYPPHPVWKWNSIIVYIGSASHSDSLHPVCLFDKACVPSQFKKTDRSGWNTRMNFF